MSKKPSKIKEMYRKERRRLQQNRRRMIKRGYTPNYSIPTLTKNPTKKDIKELVKLNENRYNYSEYVDPATGEIISGTEGRKRERSRTGVGTFNEFNAIRERLISEFPGSRHLREYRSKKRYGIIHWDGEARRNELLRIWDNTVSYAISEGMERDLLKYIKNREKQISSALEVVKYASNQDDVNVAVITLANLLSAFTPLTDDERENLNTFTYYL